MDYGRFCRNRDDNKIQFLLSRTSDAATETEKQEQQQCLSSPLLCVVSAELAICKTVVGGEWEPRY